LANNSLAFWEALLWPIIVGSDVTTPSSTTANRQAMSHSEPGKPSVCSSTPPRKKPKPFMAFLLLVNQATHWKSWPLSCLLAAACVTLMADLLAVLVRSFATVGTTDRFGDAKKNDLQPCEL